MNSNDKAESAPERSGKLADLTYKEVGSFLYEGACYVATSSDDPRGIKLYRHATEAASSSAAPSEIPEAAAQNGGLVRAALIDLLAIEKYAMGDRPNDFEMQRDVMTRFARGRAALAAPAPTWESLNAGLIAPLPTPAGCPKAYGDCRCDCHRMEGVHHFLPCCHPAALAAPRQPEDGSEMSDDDIAGPLTEAQRNHARSLYHTLYHLGPDAMEDVVRFASVSGYVNGRRDFVPKQPASAVQGGVPEAEPVAWIRKTDITELTDSEPETNGWTPLYAAPTGASK